MKNFIYYIAGIAITVIASSFLGLTARQLTAIAGFSSIFFGAIFFWQYRLAFAFLGVAGLLTAGLIDIPHIIEFAGIHEFIDSGFKAIVVRTRADLLGEDWLGREIDRGFVNDLAKLRKVDLCGELGEYHSFVYDGPLFQRPLKIVKGAKFLKDGCWTLEIPEWQLD